MKKITITNILFTSISLSILFFSIYVIGDVFLVKKTFDFNCVIKDVSRGLFQTYLFYGFFVSFFIILSFLSKKLRK